MLHPEIDIPTTANAPFGHFCKQSLRQIQPTSAGRREVNVVAGMARQPSLHLGHFVRAARGERVYLVEIETGKSHVEENVRKCHGHGQLITLFTTKAAYEAYRDKIPSTVIVLTTERLKELSRILA